MKRLMGILLTSMITAATSTPTWACTPPLGVGNIWGDLTPPSEIEYTPSEKIDKACDNAAKKWLEEHPLDIKIETETETEIQETEAEEETVETESHSFWKYYKNWFKRFK
nr:MAG TPA: hypothetical protein [Caudoviricetes sp.]